MDDLSVTDQSQLDPFWQPCSSRAVEDPDRWFDELIELGWSPPGPDPDPDDDPGSLDWPEDDDDPPTCLDADDELDAELPGEPPDAVSWSTDGDWRPAAAREGFAVGGFADAALPGPGLSGLLAAAIADGLGELSDDQLAGVLRGWQRQVAHGQARLAATVIELGRRRAAGSSRAAEHLTDELAIELTLTHRSAGRLVQICDQLDRLTPVQSALASGLIDWPRACVFADELAVLDDAAAAAIAARLVDQAARWTTGQLRAALTRAVLAADPTAAQRRRKDARKDTRVEMWHEPSGNAALAGRELAAADAIAADAALTADAGWLRDNGMPGTLAELRAAAYLARLSRRNLADLLPSDHANPDTSPADDSPGGSRIPGDSGSASGHRSGSHDSGCPADNDAAGSGSPAGRSAGPGGTGPGGLRGGTIHLTMPLAALAGLSDAPGEVAGYGPADAGTCRDLATRIAGQPATRWCLTLTGPDGRAAAHACATRGRGPAAGQPLISWATGLRDKLELLETGTCRHPRHSPGYPWPPALRHLIETRQRTCAAPGCRRPATRCDIDHTIPHDQDGPTCECNGAPLCRRHHRAKQAPGWHLQQCEPGRMTWRLPSGREYQTTGPAYLD